MLYNIKPPTTEFSYSFPPKAYCLTSRNIEVIDTNYAAWLHNSESFQLWLGMKMPVFIIPKYIKVSMGNRKQNIQFLCMFSQKEVSFTSKGLVPM